MKIRELFAKKHPPEATAQPESVGLTAVRIDLELLDECVGGQSDAESVDCYVRSMQPSVH